MKISMTARPALVLLLFAALGCSHLSKKPDSKSLLNDPRLQDMAISLRCSVFDLNGKLVRRLGGLFCSFQDDGGFFASDVMSIARYGKDLKKIWAFPLTMNHHQMTLSPYTSNLLALDVIQYKKRGQHYREDVLLVVSPGGKLVKRLKFRDILKQAEKLGFAARPPTEAEWVSKYSNPKVSILEPSHVNSFYEMWDDTSATVAGYVVNCAHQRKVYILDAHAGKVVSVIDMNGKRVHDVQYVKGKLYYYVNSDDSLQKNWLSYIGSYDLEAKKFAVVYASNEEEFSAHACSSVQLISDGLFAIFHSNCAPTPQTTAKAKFEIVDTATNTRLRIKFPKYTRANSAYLFKSGSFLRNNAGF